MKNYEQPQLEVLILSTNDIVTASGNGWSDPATKDDGTDYPWLHLGV